MAVISSVDAVLGIIAYKVKVYNDVLRDPVAKTILSHSPPAPRKQYLSRSLDIAESKLTALANAAGKDKPVTQQQEQERKQKLAQEEAAKNSNIKTVKFEKTEASFEFEPLPVPTEPVTAPTSVLTNLIKSLPMPATAKDASVTRTERVKVKVFVPEGPFLFVEVPKVATVGEVIWSTIQLYDEEKRQPPLVQLTRAYLLKMAEEDGTPEEMVLKYTDKFFNFGLFFCLVPNPSYEASSSGGAPRDAALSRDSSGLKLDKPKTTERTQSGTARKGMGTFRGTKATVRGNSVPSTDAEDVGSGKFIKVKMPDGTHTTVQLLDTASAAELLEKCCSKRKFDPDQFHLEFIDDQEEVPESQTVAQLRERAVELVANSAVAGLDTYMSDNKAMQYEVFKVTKIKAGFNAKKQERMLGIDFDRISNQMPEEALQAKSGFGKTVDVIRGRGAGVKNDYWLMTDLVEAVQDQERNKQFVLTFRDATNREKLVTYRYEAETRKVAEQIIGKLSRLIELNNKY